MAKGDAAESLGELGRWLEVLHRAAAAAALESWWSFCTRHSPHRTCRAHEALISMIECPFPAAVPLSPRPHEQDTQCRRPKSRSPLGRVNGEQSGLSLLAFSGRLVLLRAKMRSSGCSVVLCATFSSGQNAAGLTGCA